MIPCAIPFWLLAAALAALLDPALEHGPLEALFTVDEETGLTGAFGLGASDLAPKCWLSSSCMTEATRRPGG